MTEELIQKGKLAKEAAHFLSFVETTEKNRFLLGLSAALLEKIPEILTENEKDIQIAKAKGMNANLLDRLRLTPARIEAIAEGVRQTSQLPDPIGEVLQMWKNEVGLQIGKQRVPLGVIGMIYEARPNVTIDAAALCLKSGNAVILRGGSDAFYSNLALTKLVQATLKAYQFPIGCVQLIEDTSRETVLALMKLNRYLDVLIPRGGAQLIQSVLNHATVPVIETGTGNCHVYVDQHADLEMAEKIIINGKCSRPSVCNATEKVLVHEKIAKDFLPLLEKSLQQEQVEIRGDERALTYLQQGKLATEEDWQTEYLGPIIAIKVVADSDEAIAHIHQYGTKHSEAIVTKDYGESRKFHRQVDAAAVYVNASTRFTDGFEFGFGAEIGISTQKLHVRGPIGLNELTSTKYIIFGEGQIRE
ncbi:glutamate-5-semialdehyde dehydrogenase [Isobaculum melis]|uniref:Gamma-glutamyl phosphate reductase n=1 Tax=Isobaculum melis TaxID=142588 RepID=A0A1H9QL98_9LACT|nr:glutamate-5-semialdehyde dehydrogenase [Isobaculum melis]SER61351.1 glutamate-5-semialdehyde dehydrogenase [Isobaculum melis]